MGDFENRIVTDEEVRKAREVFENLYSKEALAQLNKSVTYARRNIRAVFSDPKAEQELSRNDREALRSPMNGEVLLRAIESDPQRKSRMEILEQKMAKVFHDVYIESYLTKETLPVYYALQDDPSHKKTPYDIFRNSPQTMGAANAHDKRHQQFKEETLLRLEEMGKDPSKKGELEQTRMKLAVIEELSEQAKSYYPTLDYWQAWFWIGPDMLDKMKSPDKKGLHPELVDVSQEEMKDFNQYVMANYQLAAYQMRELSGTATKLMTQIDPTFAARKEMKGDYEAFTKFQMGVRAGMSSKEIKKLEAQEKEMRTFCGMQPRCYMEGLTNAIIANEDISPEDKALADQLMRPEFRTMIEGIRKDLDKGSLLHIDSQKMRALKQSIDTFSALTSPEEMERFFLSKGENAQAIRDQMGLMSKAAESYAFEKTSEGNNPSTEMGKARLEAAHKLYETLGKVDYQMKRGVWLGEWVGNAQVDGGMMHKAAKELKNNLGQDTVAQTLEKLKTDALNVDLDSPNRDAKLAQLIYVHSIKAGMKGGNEKMAASAINERVFTSGLTMIQKDAAFRMMMKQPKESLYPLIKENGGEGLYNHFLKLKSIKMKADMNKYNTVKPIMHNKIGLEQGKPGQNTVVIGKGHK
ncbi:MAG: hypothetical protein Q4B50_01980 [Bacillota bacterium]|nr:hypothetical protein [Bacillota bacterium]